MVNYNDLISALNESNSVRETAEKLGISETSCFRYIKKYEIDYKQFFKNNRNKVFIPLETILQAQSVSNSAAETARLLGVPFTTYKRMAESYGVYETNQGLKGGKKPKSVERIKYINVVDYTVFDTFTYGSSYWLGFLASDGNVKEDKNAVTLCLQAKDLKQLQKFKYFLKTNVEIQSKMDTAGKSSNKYQSYFLTVYHHHLKKRLLELGIVPNKSNKDIDYLSYIPLEYKWSFIQGYLDGDGHMMTYLNDSISIVGNYTFLLSVQKYLDSKGIESKIYNDHNKKYKLVVGKQISKYLFCKYYVKYNTSLLLDRKLNRAKDFISMYEEKGIDVEVKRKLKRVTEIKRCKLCDKPIHHNATICRECYVKENESKKKPSREVLKEKICTLSFLKIGEEYGVSDNAVRKWCKSYNLPYQKSVIKSYTDTDWKKV